jgi:HK97 family phage major capsid protein
MKNLRLVFNAPLVALQFCLLALLSIVHTWYQRTWCLYDTPPGEIEMGVLKKALADHGIAWKAFMEQQTETMAELKARTLDLEQKAAHKPTGGGEGGGDGGLGALTDIVFKSDGLAAFRKGSTPSVEIAVPRRIMKAVKAAIINATGASQPLVVADRRPGIITPPENRPTVRDVLPAYPTSGNLVEFTRELVFTNNAGPQYDGSSPGPTTEGAVKPESSMTFELDSTQVITLAHWIPASRQVLSDAPMLQQHVEGRLLYGLDDEEDDELLNGVGTAGTLDGLINQATTFTGGSTNQTALDSMAIAIAQLAASGYAPTAIIVHPLDWWSTSIRLAKNSNGDYILGDPQVAAALTLWSTRVVTSSKMPRGRFLVLDGIRAGFIADREDATIRIAEQHADFFVRNMVVILAEERLALVITSSAAIVYGSLSYAG